MNADAVPLYPDSSACELIQIPNAHAPHDEEEGQPLYTLLNLATVNEWLNRLKMCNMDVLLVVDQCCVKKSGRDLIVMPKFKIKQAVIKPTEHAQGTKKHIGLRLLR